MHNYQLVEHIDQLLLDALNKRASDIHFEPYQHSYRIRVRIDGVLQQISSPGLDCAKQIAARLKIMAKLNIAEQRLPQDGQLVINQYAMRISTLPVINGEKIVLRLMDNHQTQRSIDELGLTQQQRQIYEQTLNHPQGLILVTGPTGSGKTVTLYSGLGLLNQTERNICSVEDPIEIPLEGINQTQINPKAGLTFAQVLRALLRQDPDVLMIGEIRDKETAEIAIQAAQTGHLVLSTLHTNSSIETLTRLNQIGIAPDLLASSLRLIIAQRLVRQLCSKCKKKSDTRLHIDGVTITHFVAEHCIHCISGYRGRIGLYEFLMITPEITELLHLHKKIPSTHIITLKQQGLQLVQAGMTTYQELQRVLGEAIL